MSSHEIETTRRQFEAYKKDVEKHGKSFFPHAMFHDTVMSLVVVSVIIGLAVVWHETADGTDAGILGPEYTDKADPATMSFIPRPDWYFYFLFYLLRIFKWPNTVVLATVGIPTVLMMLLFALPFIDRRPSGGYRAGRWRSWPRSSRPSDGHPHVEGRDGERVPRERGADDGQGLPEAEQPARCGAAGRGALRRAPAASTATRISSYGQLEPRCARPDRGGAEEPRHPVADRPPDNPASKTPGSPMPSFARLGEDNLRKLAIFLEASKGPQD